MPKTYILEPLACDDKEAQERGKKLWASVKKQLNSYGLGTEIVQTFNDMLHELQMSYSDYLLAVHSTLVRAQFFPQRKPCEIRVTVMASLSAYSVTEPLVLTLGVNAH